MKGALQLMESMNIAQGNESASLYKQELNELKIEKLGNKVTIISFILPCLIGVLLFYVYMDIKNRVVDVKDSGQNEIQMIARDVEDRLTAMTVEVARLKFSLEQQLPAITAQIEELAVLKADREETLATLDTLEKEVSRTAEQYKSAIHIIDRTSRENLDIINKTGDRLAHNAEIFKQALTQRLETVETDFNTALKALENDVAENVSTLRERIQGDLSRMESLNLEMASYEMTVKTLGEELSLTKADFKRQLQQKVDLVELESVTARLDEKVSRKALAQQVETINKNMDLSVGRLEKKISQAVSLAKKTAVSKKKQPVKSTIKAKKTPSLKKPLAPLVIPKPGEIFEGDLTQ